MVYKKNWSLGLDWGLVAWDAIGWHRMAWWLMRAAFGSSLIVEIHEISGSIVMSQNHPFLSHQSRTRAGLRLGEALSYIKLGGPSPLLWDDLLVWRILEIVYIWEIFLLYESEDVVWAALNVWKILNIVHSSYCHWTQCTVSAQSLTYALTVSVTVPWQCTCHCHVTAQWQW